MVDKKGQSALEYLMTYGWALVVIVIVIAALVILVGSPGGADSCSGSTKFTVRAVDDSTTAGTLTLIVTNATGEQVDATFTATGGGGGTDPATVVSASWLAGITKEDITFTGHLPTATGQTYSTTITINYEDPYDVNHTETLVCNGTTG